MSSDLLPAVSRNQLIGMEEYLKRQDGVVIGDSEQCPLKHSFADGIYVRQISIPAGSKVIGKIHRHDHPNFLMSGTVRVVTEFGAETLVGPVSLISKAGTKRALYAVTDLVWITVHHNPTNTQDLQEIENIIIAKDYEEFDKLQTKNLL